MVTNIRSRAVKWAHERAAEMVGMKRAGGGLVRNPAAEWQSPKDARNDTRPSSEAMRNGDGVQELAKCLRRITCFRQHAPNHCPNGNGDGGRYGQP
ncbi:hypothetical protein ND436_002600 [Neisseria gonorrhoeae]|nr:hypothetical protein [Neisseria gonorrhoeae]UYP52438.1 hypothetical protein ND436_002600 [Neisseria gonorrhoeae]